LHKKKRAAFRPKTSKGKKRTSVRAKKFEIPTPTPQKTHPTKKHHTPTPPPPQTNQQQTPKKTPKTTNPATTRQLSAQRRGKETRSNRRNQKHHQHLQGFPRQEGPVSLPHVRVRGGKNKKTVQYLYQRGKKRSLESISRQLEKKNKKGTMLLHQRVSLLTTRKKKKD